MEEEKTIEENTKRTTRKEENEKNERVLSDDQIDELYHLLADESIELEKNS